MASLDSVDIGDNLHWSDEGVWNPVAQATDRTLDGALVVEETANAKGRPITLEGAWLTGATISSLQAIHAQVATPMTLTLPDGRTFQVLWRRDTDGGGLEAVPVFPVAVTDAATLYDVTLRLMEVAP